VLFVLPNLIRFHEPCNSVRIQIKKNFACLEAEDFFHGCEWDTGSTEWIDEAENRHRTLILFLSDIRENTSNLRLECTLMNLPLYLGRERTRTKLPAEVLGNPRFLFNKVKLQFFVTKSGIMRR
jgi:hypothetical protein